MKLLVQILLAPFSAFSLMLSVIDRVIGGNRRRRVATHAGQRAAIGDGMTIGALVAAVLSLAVILFSDGLGVPARALPLVTALPLLGGYVGAALGFHLGGNEPGVADGHADEKWK